MASPSLTCYALSRSRKSLLLAEAMAAGSGGRIAINATDLAPGPALFYGLWPENAELVRAAQARRRLFGGPDWFYADNGYLGQGSYRIARNGWQIAWDAKAESDGRRLAALGRSLQPWAPNPDGAVLICLQKPEFFAWRREDLQAWLFDTQARLTVATKRTVAIRAKPRKPRRGDFLALLCGPNRPWAVVGRSSSCLFEALIEGVPAFATHPCALPQTQPLEEIETPREPPDRARWAAVLADNQWTLAEIQAGDAWRHLTAPAEMGELACA